MRVALASLLLAATAPFPMRAAVSPTVMPYNAHPTLTVTAPRGAVCSAHVRYSTGRKPVSFHEVTITSSGSAAWRWHEETKGTGGVATVSCTYHGASETRTATFRVTHR